MSPHFEFCPCNPPTNAPESDCLCDKVGEQISPAIDALQSAVAPLMVQLYELRRLAVAVVESKARCDANPVDARDNPDSWGLLFKMLDAIDALKAFLTSGTTKEKDDE